MARSKARLFAFAAIAAGGPALVACHLITGLDDYNKVECSGLLCSDGGLDVNFDVPTIDQKNPDVVIVDAQGTAPVNWARWKMPNYDTDGGIENPHSYADAGGAIRDNVTGLVWLQPMPAGGNELKTFDAAKKLCESAPGGGWRLPSRIELVTLLDLFASGAKMNGSFFPGAPQGVYWTYSEVRPLTAKKYWAVDFDQGGVAQRDVGATAFVRCVKGGT